MSSVEVDIRNFIIENFLYGDTESKLPSDSSLLDLGIIDSTGVLELVHFIEKQYGIEIEDNELIPANLDSINRLVEFIRRKTAVST
jgi:acyl carrier protein